MIVLRSLFSKSDGSEQDMPADIRRPDHRTFAGLVNHDTAPRFCDNCDGEMTHLRDLPGHLGAAPIRIHQCYQCNRVVSETR